MPPVTRRRFLQVAGPTAVVGVAGCSADNGADSGTTADTGDSADSDGINGEAPTVDDPPAANPPVAAERLPMYYSTAELARRSVNGGVGRDGIPSIDDPSFVDADAAGEFLDPDDIVFGYTRDGIVKAYPQRIVVWHEIVNDRIDGHTVSITYCPLTGTVIGVHAGQTTFGVTGDLVNNNLIMYDRNTDSRWVQALGTSHTGEFQGYSLREFRLLWTTWGRWRALHPETQVMSRDTGYIRNYAEDPYGSYNPRGSYYRAQYTPYQRFNPNDRFPWKHVVLGARAPDVAISFVKDSLREQKVMEAGVDGPTVAAVYDERLDTGYVYRNPDDRSISVEGPRAIIDGESHPPDALPLERVLTFDAMWFAWSGFYPNAPVAS